MHMPEPSDTGDKTASMAATAAARASNKGETGHIKCGLSSICKALAPKDRSPA